MSGTVVRMIITNERRRLMRVVALNFSEREKKSSNNMTNKKIITQFCLRRAILLLSIPTRRVGGCWPRATPLGKIIVPRVSSTTTMMCFTGSVVSSGVPLVLVSLTLVGSALLGAANLTPCQFKLYLTQNLNRPSTNLEITRGSRNDEARFEKRFVLHSVRNERHTG